jgi:hypothetical protein
MPMTGSVSLDCSPTETEKEEKLLMDFEYMMSPFHQAQYQFFYQTVPSALRTPFVLEKIIEGAQEGVGNHFLVGFWRGTAKRIYDLGMEDALPAEVDATRDDFSMAIRQPVPGMTMLLMTGLAPRGPVEAGCAVAIFEDADPDESLRYFTTESPMDQSSPWMVGEWYADGGRGNLGAISDLTVEGLAQFVLRVLGI